MSVPRRRKNIRLPTYDYRQPGNYFVTICTDNRLPVLSDIVATEVCLTTFGEIVQAAWLDIPLHHAGVAVDEMVVMPNHIHGIITILSDTDGMSLNQSSSLGSVIGSFKSATSRNINRLRGTPGSTIWQMNYYEHIIRNERSLDAIRAYIAGNPADWSNDPENPYRDP